MAARRKAAKAKKPTRTRKAGRARVAAESGAPPFPEIEALVELMDRHGLQELEYLSSPDGTREVRISRVSGGAEPSLSASSAASSAPAEPVPEEPAVADRAPAEDLHAVVSPMVGTFFRAASPEAPPFVSVGDQVDEKSTLCIIEAMKVLNEINPDARGEIVSIEVENGEAVEYGQTLFRIRPS